MVSLEVASPTSSRRTVMILSQQRPAQSQFPSATKFYALAERDFARANFYIIIIRHLVYGQEGQWMDEWMVDGWRVYDGWQDGMVGWSDLMPNWEHYGGQWFIMMILVRCICLVLLLLAKGDCSAFKRYTDYGEYMSEWLAMVPQKQVFNVSHMALDDEQCYGTKCHFYYFEATHPSPLNATPKDHGSNSTEEHNSTFRTVLLVSGMHGDEFIGPHTLLYAYKHLQADRIVYFPVANPSGFARGRRETWPGGIDVNRDFPVDGNRLCYRTTATHILDMLFRKYHFDLTVALHNGGSGAEISFNWGTFTHASNSHTADYDILSAIASMLQRQGGESRKLGLMRLKTGTMDEVVYPATGTFDDWAYAAGKFPEVITTCTGYEYVPYPSGMANGLVFLLELGPKAITQLGSETGIDLPPLSNSSNNGFVARGVRMLKGLLRVMHPQLKFSHQGSLLGVSVEGCQNTDITSLTVFKKQGEEWLKVLELQVPLQLQGDVRNATAEETILNLTAQVRIGEMVRYEGSFNCDSGWQGKGTSSFALPRQFTLDVEQVAKPPPPHEEEQGWDEQYLIGGKDMLPIGIAVVILLVLGGVYWMFKRCFCRTKKVQKFDEVTVESQQGVELQGGDLHTARGGIIDM